MAENKTRVAFKRTTGALTPEAQTVMADFERDLQDVEDLQPSTLRAYLADLRYFAFWCEEAWGDSDQGCFRPEHLTTPLITRFRTHLQDELALKPASVNRALVSIKRFTAWAARQQRIHRDPARPVRFVRLETTAPRGLTDHEEDALVRAVTRHGTLRDRSVIVLMLHTGLRVSETSCLERCDVTLAKRGGHLTVTGKGNNVRDIPLNSTARDVLNAYLPSLPPAAVFVFSSNRRPTPLSTRALDHLIRKYAHLAKLDLSAHNLRHRFGYVMAEQVPLHRLAQIMGHDSLDTTARYIRATRQDLQAEVEKITWR